ncbi:MAG: maleylpyruvate isomerase family mycothiol-dependent enzyme [Acidimicrobiales bacterium]
MSNGSQEPVVDVLAEVWRSIADLGAGLDGDEWDLPSECPGWTVRDVVGHMVGTEHSLLGAPAPPPLSAPAHVHNAVGAANEGWVASLRDLGGPEMMEQFRDATGRRLEQMRSWPAARFDEIGPSPVGMVPYREFMAVRVMDCWVHEQDIRVATARPGHHEGPAATLAIDRLTSAMPFVVAKQAKAPDGSSVRFELMGREERRLDVVVRNGRAAIDQEPAEPTVDLRMDLEVFWRLGCGRVSGPAARGAGLVEIRGDEALGQRVVDSMAFMI